MTRNLIGLLLLVALHLVGLHMMAEWRIMEAVLAPNRNATFALMAAVLFLLIRITLFAIGPGAALALLYWRFIPTESDTPAERKT